MSVLVDDIIAMVPVLQDDVGVFQTWLQLARTYSVTGVNSHDMRIIAAMLRHGINLLLTANPRDFRRYAGIQVVTPGEVVAAAES